MVITHVGKADQPIIVRTRQRTQLDFREPRMSA